MANKYEDVLLGFVGSWESWLDYIEPRSKRSSNITDKLPLFLSHLEFTAHTTIAALRYNNIEAAGWGVDMLNNWIDKVSFQDHWHEEYSWQSEIITHNILEKPQTDNVWMNILNGENFNPDAAFELAITNAAFDIRIVTACFIMLKPLTKDDKKIRSYIVALLDGTDIHPTGGVGRGNKHVRTPSDILGAYIRHRDYGSYEDNGYSAWLSKVLESFGRVNESKKISGRIYSGWGVNDPRSLNKAYIEIAISFSKSKWQLERKWLDIILSNAFSHVDRDSIRSDLNDWLTIAEEITDSVLLTEDEHSNNLAHFKSSIESIIEQITRHQVEIITSSEVDQELLTNFGKVSSSQLNNLHASPYYPINLFKNIRSNTKCEDKYLFKLNIQKYLKERIAVNLAANRAINEDEWLQNATNNNIKTNILRALLKYEVSESQTYDSIQENINDLLTLSKNIEEPILFVGDNNLIMDIRKARYYEDIASKYNVSFYDGFGSDYVCHIGTVEVYNLRFSDVSFSLLTSKKLFSSIEFSKVDDMQYVKVEFTADEDNESIGTLSLNYWMDISLLEGIPCIKTSLSLKEDS